MIDHLKPSCLSIYCATPAGLGVAFAYRRLNRRNDCAATGQGSLNQILQMIGRSAANANIAGAHQLDEGIAAQIVAFERVVADAQAAALARGRAVDD